MNPRSLKVKHLRPMAVPPLFRTFRRENPDFARTYTNCSTTATNCFQPRYLELREAGRPRRWLVVSSTHRAEVRCIVHYHYDAFSKAIFGFRSQSCKTRICNVVCDDALTEQWGVRHDLYARSNGRVVFKVRGGRDGGCRDLASSSSTRKSGFHLT